MQVDKQLMCDILDFFVLGMQSYLPEGLHADQLIKSKHLNFLKMVQILFGLVDLLKVLLEHFYQA